MAQIIANLTLDTYRKNNIPPLVVPQGDYGAREIRVNITNHAKPVTVESTAAVSIVAERSGDGEALAFSGEVNADGSVTVPVTQWMLDVPEEDVTCHVVVTGSGYQYSTTSFLIEPQVKANPTEITPDDPRVDVVTEVLANENTRQAAEATRVSNENARKTAENARQSAETQRLTDEATRVANEVERVSAESSRDATFKGWANDIASLPSFDARISANSDRITNLEAGLPASVWSVDDSTAYVKDVPTNARPRAIISKIGGMTRKCTNLWDEQWEVGGLDVETGGNYTTSDRIRGKNFCKCLPNTQYHVPPNIYLVFYDINKNWLRYVTPDGVKTSPDNAYYFKVCGTVAYGTSYNNDIMICEGDTALPYEPYFEGLRDAKVTGVKSVGVNLCPPFVKGIKINTNNGDEGEYSKAAATDFFAIDLENNDYLVNGLNSKLFSIFAVYDINKKYLGRTSAGAYGGIKISKSSITNGNAEGARYARISTYENSMVTGTIDLVDAMQVMVNPTRTALPYVPYQSETIPIPEAVQALDGWGQGIPGTDYYNFVDWRPEDGVTEWRHVKDRFIFDGSEVWIKGTGDYVFLADTSILPSIPKSSGAVGNTHDYEVELSNQNIVVKTTMTADEFAAELATLYEAGTPFIVDYERNNPEVTDISDLLPADNLISVEGGGTLTFENEHDYDMPNTVTYMLKEVTA